MGEKGTMFPATESRFWGGVQVDGWILQHTFGGFRVRSWNCWVATIVELHVT